MMADFEVTDEGTIFLVCPNTDAAREWLRENVQEGAMRWGMAVVVEHGYIDPLVDGIIKAGFTVG